MIIHKLHTAFVLIILSFMKLGKTTGGVPSKANIECLMPEEIPESLSMFYNQTSWNALRQRQRHQVERRGGCPQRKKEMSCQILSREIVALTGYCRYVDQTAMCAVFDKRYHESTTMWPRHRECGHTIFSSRLKLHRYEDVTYLDRIAARKKAKMGAMPANVDSRGNQLTLARCTVRQQVRKERKGNCEIVHGSVYGCRAGSKLQIWHPVCSYLAENGA
ncbi:uncharacterized protein LOC120330216 [Styela clava]